MNIAIILLVSLIVFWGIRLVLIFLYWVIQKIFKLSEGNMSFDLGISIFFYIMYIQAFLGSVLGVSRNSELSNMEWYFVYTFIGIISMLWCYFSWDLRLKAKPKLGLNDKQVIVKKIVVFALVMVISIINGYDAMCKEFSGENDFWGIRVLNSTMIVGIIAFDRVLNQVVNYLKIYKQEQEVK